MIYTYIICQDTLFVQRHAFFDLSLVTDHRLADHHFAGNVNIIPYVGTIQDDVVTWCDQILQTLVPIIITHTSTL